MLRYHMQCTTCVVAQKFRCFEPQLTYRLPSFTTSTTWTALSEYSTESRNRQRFVRVPHCLAQPMYMETFQNGSKETRTLKLNTDLHLVQSLRMHGPSPLLPSTCLWCGAQTLADDAELITRESSGLTTCSV
jgi:hypothetical protein